MLILKYATNQSIFFFIIDQGRRRTSLNSEYNAQNEESGI